MKLYIRHGNPHSTKILLLYSFSRNIGLRQVSIRPIPANALGKIRIIAFLTMLTSSGHLFKDNKKHPNQITASSPGQILPKRMLSSREVSSIP